jgi:hypothetical protein
MSSSMMNAVFIIAPFNAHSIAMREAQIRNAEACAAALWVAGFAPICIQAQLRFISELQDDMYHDGAKELLRRCDAAIVVEWWKQDVNCISQVMFAKESGVKTFISISAVSAYFNDDNTIVSKYAWEDLK